MVQFICHVSVSFPSYNTSNNVLVNFSKVSVLFPINILADLTFNDKLHFFLENKLLKIISLDYSGYYKNNFKTWKIKDFNRFGIYRHNLGYDYLKYKNQ